MVVIRLYLVIVYDIKVERVNSVKKFLRQNLFWVQNSVFEGEVTESEYEYITTNLYKIINEEEDSVIIYKIKFADLMEKNILGIEKASLDTIL